MSRKFVCLDADESIFFSRQLEFVKAKTYDRLYPEIKARQLIPVNFDTPSGAETVTYYQYDIVGMAKIISNYASDLPRVDLKGKQFTGKIRSLGDSYGYSLQDIRAARLAGVPLEQRKANAAKLAMLQLEENIAVNGDADYDLVGLLSHPNIPDVAIPANGTGSSSLWSTKTADQILADLELVVDQIVSTTKGVETPDTLLLPLSAHSIIKNLRVGETGKTVLQWFLDNNEYIKNVIVWPRLAGAGAGGTNAMIAYRRDPDKLQLEVPQDFEQLPVQEKSLDFEVPCHQRCGGVIIYYPLSLAKADGF